jgi:hypothetical protein
MFVYLTHNTNLMNNPTTFNGTEILKDIREKETLLKELGEKYRSTEFEIQELKRLNAANITIQWKESIKNCLEQEASQSSYFLKTPAFISNCVAWTYGVELTRDIKNKIATTLSFMFNQGAIGRIQHNGKTFYGMPKFFKTDLVTLKRDYADWIEDLIP